jgi:hypothetical protein
LPQALSCDNTRGATGSKEDPGNFLRVRHRAGSPFTTAGLARMIHAAVAGLD